MTVIPFTSFVVVPHDTYPINNVGKTIFERVLRRRNGRENPPHHHFCKGIDRKDNATPNEQSSLHVGHYDNMKTMLSKRPTTTEYHQSLESAYGA